MSIRHDKKTGKCYTWHNIPIGRVHSAQSSKGYYVIFESNHSYPNDSWYNDVKVSGDYAVFKWVNTTPSQGFYQQVTKWYKRYGYAQLQLFKLSHSKH